MGSPGLFEGVSGASDALQLSTIFSCVPAFFSFLYGTSRECFSVTICHGRSEDSIEAVHLGSANLAALREFANRLDSALAKSLGMLTLCFDQSQRANAVHERA